MQVWPGHGAGSACGKALGSVPSTTVGYEKIRNWAFQYGDDKIEFTKELLAGQPEAPRYFAMMKKLNRLERPLLMEVPAIQLLSKEDFLTYYAQGLLIIDTRNKAAYAKGHLEGTLNIQGNKSFATWMGWTVDYDQPFVLIAEDGQIEDLTRKLMRIGMDHIIGYYSDIASLSLPMKQVDNINTDTFSKLLKDNDVQVVDVRNGKEFAEGHVEGATHAFVGTLQSQLHLFDPQKQVVVYCQAGDRSTIAYSILEKNGFSRIKNYAGGIKEWKASQRPLVK